MTGYLYQVGKTWYDGVKDGRRWIRRSARTRYKEVAKTKMRETELRLAQGSPLEDHRGKTFAAFTEEYLKHKASLGHDVSRDHDCLGHLLPAFGGKPIAEIEREAVERYVAQRLSEKARALAPCKRRSTP